LNKISVIGNFIRARRAFGKFTHVISTLYKIRKLLLLQHLLVPVEERLLVPVEERLLVPVEERLLVPVVARLLVPVEERLLAAGLVQHRICCKILDSRPKI
jgi:hypothetical protein